MDQPRRRQFLPGSLALVGLSLLSSCAGLPLLGQRPAPLHRIGRLTGTLPSAADDTLMAVLRQALLDLGYREGQNVRIEARYANGDDRLEEPAAELVRLQAEVIVVASAMVARAVHAATSTIPIVSSGIGDLLATGLAVSLGRPGGNVTGLSTPLLVSKQLQLLKDAVPTLSRVAVFFDTTNPVPPDPYDAAADALGLTLQFEGSGGTDDLEAFFTTVAGQRCDGLFVINGPLISLSQARISALALQSGLPSMWQQTEPVGRGGLMGYGPNRPDMYRRTATFVDRILKGADPAEMPLEQPTLFDFVINLTTAQVLGLTIPPSVLAQATEVIS